MPDTPAPTLRLTVDRQALASNWRALDALSGQACAGAAVKADCYGLGIDNCLPALRESGARDFFVAHWCEVADVLAHAAPEQVSVLHGPLTDDDCAFARATGVRPVINSLAQAARWMETGGGPIDLMVDTGINRLGLSMAEIGDPLVSRLEVETLMSHLACADEDVLKNAQQLERFRQAAVEIPAKRLSLANSAGIALGGDYAFNLTRPGLALYGGIPRPELSQHIRQVAHLEAAIIRTRELSAGDTVGYNALYTARAPMRVGVVSLGYADGLLRSWFGGALRHNQATLPILGKISMDMVVVDLSQAPGIGEGDWLSVPYALHDAAQHTGLSQYELLTVIGRRFHR